MTILSNSGAGGTPGVVATLENTGGTSGTAFSINSGAGLWEFSSTAMHGPVGYHVLGNAAQMLFGWTGLATSTLSLRLYLRLPSYPTVAEQQLITARNPTTAAGGLNITTAGALRVTKLGGAAIFTSPALSLETWYRVEMAWEVGTDATTGKVWFSLFVGDSTTPVSTFSTAATDLGVDLLKGAQWGKHSANNSAEYFFDSIEMDDASTALRGPAVAPTATTAHAGPNVPDVEAYTTVTLTGSGATAGVYKWRQISGPVRNLPNTTSPALTFKTPATKDGALLTFGLTVNDPPSAEDTVTVGVRPCVNWYSDGSGGWLPLITYAFP